MAAERGRTVGATLSKKAAKALEALDEPLRSRIVAGIYKLPSGDIKKLKGYDAAFRLRIGDYRVIFEMTADEIYISDILPRGNAYKN
jgi:mRNA interferase RelE/StbE